MPSSSEPSPLAAFQEQYRKDQESGKLRTVREYLDLFPGDDDAVAHAYLETRAAEVTSTSDAAGGLIGHYRIIKELGRGGQGVVYLAEDTRLHRNVALKVLTHLGPGSEDAVARFRRESEITSRLDHPAICAIHDAGLVGSIPFIAMRHVDGETLAQRIDVAKQESMGGDADSIVSVWEVGPAESEHEPPQTASGTVATSITKDAIAEIVRLFKRAAHAMHAAHEAGIVHRDIKPGNIMVTPDGAPVVLDFGMAHSDDLDLQTLTRTGDLFGTPAYMSPEQLTRGTLSLDRRTDIYSLGATMYECLTLRRPFEAPAREKLYQVIMTQEPAPPRKLNPHIPPALEVVLQKTLEKDRERRYSTAQDLAEDLRRVHDQEPILARQVGKMRRLMRWTRRRPAISTAIAAVLLVTTALGIAFSALDGRDDDAASPPAEPATASIAVLPLADAGAAADSRLGDGIAEQLTVALGSIPGLTVAGRTSASHFRDQDLSAQEIGKRLGVATVLSGSVLRSGEKIRILVRLESARNGFLLWSHQFDGEIGEIFEIQDTIARSVAAELPGKLLRGRTAPLVEAPTADLEAYRLYLEGRFQWSKRGEGLVRALDLFEQAAGLDQDFALAHSGIASAQTLLGLYGYVPFAPAFKKAKDAANRALELDPKLAEAHAILAYLSMVSDWDWAAAERSFKKALALDPNYPATHYWYGQYLYLVKGNASEYVTQSRIAVRIDPLSPIATICLGHALLCANKPEEALRELRRSDQLHRGCRRFRQDEDERGVGDTINDRSTTG